MYTTSDIGIAAYLQLKGLKLTECKRLETGKFHFSLGGERLWGLSPPPLQYKPEAEGMGRSLQKLIIGLELGEQDRILRSLLFILMANE